MIVNLYVDHLMSTPPGSAEDVWNATREHARLFTDAANRIGLTPSEYQEFRNALLDGKALYVRLPKRMDAMSGNRHGSVYAVRNAVMNQPELGWSVSLANGDTVYVPQVCGNISLLRHAAVAAAAKPARHVAAAKAPYRYTQAMGSMPRAGGGIPVAAGPAAPAVVPVDFTPPVVVAAPLAAAPVLAAAAPVAAASGGGFPFFIPAALGGLIFGASHHGGSTPAAPVAPCSAGSNSQNACQIASGFLRR